MFCRVHFVFSFQLFFSTTDTFRLQRWSPRGHILKSLVSKLQVLENCPVLGSRTAVFLESLKFCRSFFVEKLVFFGEFLILFFWEHLKKIFLKTLFFYLLENTCACVLALERVCPQKGCLWPRIFFCVLGLEPCALNSTSVPCPFKPNVERLSPLSHISFYINFIQSTAGNTTDGAWCVAWRCRLSSQIVEQFECANTLNYNLFRI